MGEKGVFRCFGEIFPSDLPYIPLFSFTEMENLNNGVVYVRHGLIKAGFGEKGGLLIVPHTHWTEGVRLFFVYICTDR